MQSACALHSFCIIAPNRKHNVKAVRGHPTQCWSLLLRQSQSPAALLPLVPAYQITPNASGQLALRRYNTLTTSRKMALSKKLMQLSIVFCARTVLCNAATSCSWQAPSSSTSQSPTKDPTSALFLRAFIPASVAGSSSPALISRLHELSTGSPP